MNSKMLSFVGRNKASFIVGIFLYFSIVVVFWFLEWNGHYSRAALVLGRVLPPVSGGMLALLGFPYTVIYYQNTFLDLISYPIGIFWCGLCVVVVRKLLTLLKPFFSKNYIFYHVKNGVRLRVFIIKGIVIGIFGSLISMLFNIIFIIAMETLASIYDWRYLVAVFERDNYVLLISLYVVSSLLSGVIYGLLMFYLSTYNAIRILLEDRL